MRKINLILDGIKIAGYVDCQTNHPFGIDGSADMIVTKQLEYIISK